MIYCRGIANIHISTGIWKWYQILTWIPRKLHEGNRMSVQFGNRLGCSRCSSWRLDGNGLGLTIWDDDRRNSIRAMIVLAWCSSSGGRVRLIDDRCPSICRRQRQRQIEWLVASSKLQSLPIGEESRKLGMTARPTEGDELLLDE